MRIWLASAFADRIEKSGGLLTGAGTVHIESIRCGVASAAIITSFGWVTKVSLLSIVLGFLVSFAPGVTFGLYPALWAAALEPVDAMRNE